MKTKFINGNKELEEIVNRYNEKVEEYQKYLESKDEIIEGLINKIKRQDELIKILLKENKDE